MNNIQDHNLTFKSNLVDLKFVETVVSFKKFYAVAPQVNIWIEAISPDISNDEFPYFNIPSHLIKNDCFSIFHTEFDWAKFKIYYRVYEVKLEELERGSL